MEKQQKKIKQKTRDAAKAAPRGQCIAKLLKTNLEDLVRAGKERSHEKLSYLCLPLPHHHMSCRRLGIALPGTRRSGQILNCLALGLALIYNLSSLNQPAS